MACAYGSGEKPPVWTSTSSPSRRSIVRIEQTFRAAVGTARWRIKFVVLALVIMFGARISLIHVMSGKGVTPEKGDVSLPANSPRRTAAHKRLRETALQFITEDQLEQTIVRAGKPAEDYGSLFRQLHGLDVLIYGAMLVLFIIYMPKGILGTLIDRRRKRRPTYRGDRRCRRRS